MQDSVAKIWYITDIHGSNKIFRKFLNLPKNANKPNVIIIGADLTGKQIVPLIDNNEHSFYLGKELKSKNELLDVKKRLSDLGFYPFECTESEYKKFENEKYKEQKFKQLAKERLIEWVNLIETKLDDLKDCMVIINAGNDDPLWVDKILDKSTKVIRPEGKIIELPAGLKLLSTGYSNLTPWGCPRDISEEKLYEKVTKMTSQLKENDKIIFNFHCPPFNTSLDLAQNIDKATLHKKTGKQIHVGSTAIRKAIEVWQPIVSLHGHIHEVYTKERIGNTICYNPGSNYSKGDLQSVFLKIDSNGKIEYESLVQEKNDQSEDTFITRIISLIPYVGNAYREYKSGKKQDEILASVKEINNKLNN
jgi:uncharacterized protein